ncbi:MAG: lipase [Cyclobacteriaceae bacterium]|nr:MAG: lipase [Cyclobacteriaceae bacterium]
MMEQLFTDRAAPLKLNFIILYIALMLMFSAGFAQDRVLYKQVDTIKLSMEIYYPVPVDSDKTNPAMVFFFGGGWVGGSIAQFAPHAKYFAKRGITCFLAEYRIRDKHQTTPFESLKDAKSAIRYIRKNAAKFKVDPDSIIASGGSAGGHLAAATALIEVYNEDSDDLSISCIPNALVLYNPVIDNGPGGYGFDRIGNKYKDFSPLHNIKHGAPPTIIFLGTEDKLIPVETVEYYKVVMEKLDSKCDLKIYQGQGHGFFNHGKFEYYQKTVREADLFLQKLGYLPDNQTVKIE